MSRVSKPQDIVVYLDREEKKHGYLKGSPYTANIVYRTILEEEIEKYKESEDYKGPDLFDEGINVYNIPPRTHVFGPII